MALVMAIVNESHEIGACEHLASNQVLHLAIDCELGVKPPNRQIFQFLRQLKSTTLYLL
jgi:hypothetical protein